MGKSLAKWTAEIAEVNEQLGWNAQDVSFPEAMAMLHSEVSEALEAWRDKGTAGWECITLHNGPPYLETRCERGEITYKVDGMPCTLEQLRTIPGIKIKPEGVGSEFADVLIRLLDDCRRFGIDIEKEMKRKIAYNRTREYRHGGKRI